MREAVGIPKERKPGERRVALTPAGVLALTKKGISVLVEENAGSLSGFTNDDYKKSGAIISSVDQVWDSPLIKKVKEPIKEEFSFFKPNQIIFSFLHLAAPPSRLLIDALIKSQVTAIAYETIEKDNDTPLLKPMSEVAGVLAAYYGAIFQRFAKIEHGKIVGLDIVKNQMELAALNYPKMPAGITYQGKVAILGGGHVGEKAAEIAAQMGAQVYISEISEKRRDELKKHFSKLSALVFVISPSDEKEYLEKLEASNVIIAAVHAPGKRAPIIINDELLEKISKETKKIILDIAIDQGGNISQSQSADYEKLLYLDPFDNIRFSVSNIPSLCGSGASKALEESSVIYTEALAQGFEQAIQRYPELKSGINLLKGKIIHPAVLDAYNLR